MRFLFLVLTLSALFFAGVHCGDITNVPDTIIIVNPDTGPIKLQEADSSSPEADAGSLPDSSQDGPGCVFDRSPVSDWCQIEKRCGGGQCAAPGSFLYQCFDSGGGTRPDIEGCTSLEPTGSVTQWCCPPACVHSVGGDGQCPGGKFYFCPTDGDGGTAVKFPTDHCTKVDAQGVATDYCCTP